MPLQLKLVWLLTITALLLLASCAKEFSCEGCNVNTPVSVNRPPVADAGADQTLTLPVQEIFLNGSSSTDPDSNIVSYGWTRIDGPSPVTFTNATAVQTAVNNLVEGIYAFELKVTDVGGLSATDTLFVTINQSNSVPRWTKLDSVPTNEYLSGTYHINFLLAIQDSLFTVSKLGSFWKYNVQSNKWGKTNELPTFMASSNFSVVFSINNTGYFVGNGVSRQFNVVTRQWTSKTNAPTGDNHVDYSVPLVIGDKAYLVGSTNNLVHMYDPASDTYTLKNKFPDRDAATGFVIDGIGYCLQKDGRCWQYNPVADTWHRKANLPSSVYNISGLTLNGYGYIIGDLNRAAFNGTGQMKLWRFDPNLNRWEAINADYPGQGVYAIRTVSLNGIAYVGLGYNSKDDDARDF